MQEVCGVQVKFVRISLFSSLTTLKVIFFLRAVALLRGQTEDFESSSVSFCTQQTSSFRA